MHPIIKTGKATRSVDASAATVMIPSPCAIKIWSNVVFFSSFEVSLWLPELFYFLQKSRKKKTLWIKLKIMIEAIYMKENQTYWQRVWVSEEACRLWGLWLFLRGIVLYWHNSYSLVINLHGTLTTDGKDIVTVREHCRRPCCMNDVKRRCVLNFRAKVK